MDSQITGTVMDVTILDGPDKFHQWFAQTKGSVPEDLWEYFNPEASVEFIVPEPVTFSTIKEGAQSLQQLTSSEKALFNSLRTLYNTDLAQYQRFLSEGAKLRNRVNSTVSRSKKTQLLPDKTVREWIKALQKSTKPTDVHMQAIVKARHRAMMGVKYLEWPTDGPDQWIEKWQNLMDECERWCPPFYEMWASDFNLVWGEVAGAQRLCDRLTDATTKNDLEEWDIPKASLELKHAWDQKAIRSGMKIAGKGKITKGAFAVEPRFDGSGASEEKTDESPAEPAASAAPSNPKKRTGTESHQGSSNKKHKSNRQRNEQQSCWGCGGDHFPQSCLLIKDFNPRKRFIPDKNKKTFQENMKDSDFAAQVKKIRETEEAKRDLYKRKKE
jgi:hypothetical protein